MFTLPCLYKPITANAAPDTAGKKAAGETARITPCLLEMADRMDFEGFPCSLFVLIPGRTGLNFHNFASFHFSLECEKDTGTGPPLAGELLLLLLT